MQIFRLSDELDPLTKYYLYAVYRNDYEISEVMHLTFTTSDFNCTELLTVLSTQYDGYKMRITVPEYTKAAGNAIRYHQCCLMMYNYNVTRSDDLEYLLDNGHNWTMDDISLEYSDEDNLYQTDDDMDGDGEPDWDLKYNPITPGEPVVFVAGEFAWADETYDGSIDQVKNCVESWGNGYYKPLMNDGWYNMYKDDYTTHLDGMHYTKPIDAAWQGAFQRKVFRVKEPAQLDGRVRMEISEITSDDARLEFYPDDSVHQYAVLILDDASYEEFMSLINYREEFKQWAVASYFSFNYFCTRLFNEPVYTNLSSYFVEVQPDARYHVLVTAMGDSQGLTQSFNEYTFYTPPEI